MKTFQIALLCFCLLLSACSQPIIYKGEKRPKTTSVTIYNLNSEIKRPYKVLGYLKAHKYSEKIETHDLTRFGKRIGADAIIILGVDSSRRHIDAEAIKFD